MIKRAGAQHHGNVVQLIEHAVDAAARLFQDVSAFCVDVVRKALQCERDGQKLLRYAVVQLA